MINAYLLIIAKLFYKYYQDLSSSYLVNSIWQSDAWGVPKISKVIVRDPYTLEVLNDGKEGLLQFLNPIPYSYPGLSVLTDDLGIKKTSNNKEYFEITGRAKNSEIRGCGDILSEAMWLKELIFYTLMENA